MTSKEKQQEMVSTMRKWQKIEDSSIASTGQIMQKTNNPIIRLVMEIIQHDSRLHHLVQEWIADSLEFKTVTLNPDELNEVWTMIEHHIDIENKMLESAEQMLNAADNKFMLVQRYLLNYLVDDERKHNHMLSHLEMLKKGMQY